MSIEGTPESPQHSFTPLNEPHPHKGSRYRVLLYVVLVIAAGLIVWRIHQNQQQAAAVSASQAAALQNQPVAVQVVDVERKPMPVYLSGLGTVTPYMSVTVKARVSGELQPVKFTEGQQVRKGETIMVIDPKPYKAALDQAKGNLAHDEALLKNAQAQYARYKALYAAGVVSKETLDADEAAQGQYEGAIAADKAAIENAQLQLNWCYIQSPINGKIGLRLVDPGNIISANTTNLIVINQLQPIAIYFTLPENQLPQVLKRLVTDIKMPVEAWDRNDQAKLAEGVLLTADNQIDTTTGTGKLKAVFENKDGSLYPNQFVNIRLVLENKPDALVVPTAAIQSGRQGPFVWVIDTDAKGVNKARIQLVKVALAEGQTTVLDSGLESGQQIVVDGADRLSAGKVVAVSGKRKQTTQNAVESTPSVGKGRGKTEKKEGL
jgi:membrane fusion protein, multidrug efflux system